MKKFIFLLSLFCGGCIGIPGDIKPVQSFDVNRYLGTWYEIARLDHSFERGLEQVTAHYSLRQDGGIKVVNRGFNPKTNTWKEAIGKAYFLADPDVASLKVSFFGPFYGGYHIIALDKVNYSYSLVCGPNKSYLWILARKPDMEQSVKSELIKKAKALGFETEKLIHVKQLQG
ncbi:MAG: lipocalin family protein [Deltaproteobacteria bacterium]|nr:lipocalin family protein [Deltaproteobacteria bacterium]